MSRKHIAVVFLKELKDTLRDRKTLLSSIFLPVIVLPLMLFFVGGGLSNLQEDISTNTTVAVIGGQGDAELFDFVRDELLASDQSIKLIKTAEPAEDLRRGRVKGLIIIEEGYSQKVLAEQPFEVKIVYNPNSAASSGSAEKIIQAVSAYNANVGYARLTQLGIDPSILTPAMVGRQKLDDYLGVPENERAGTDNMLLQLLLPLAAGVFVISGGMAAAIDLFAGEKERKTFEPLLTTRAGRMSILVAKYMVVLIYAFISCLAQVLGLVIGGLLQPDVFGMYGQLALPAEAIVLTFANILLLGMIFAGIEIFLSMLARTFREAQTYVSMLLFIPLFITYATLYIQSGDIKLWYMLVPVLNAICSIKLVLAGDINTPMLVISAASSLAYLMLTLLATRRMFNRENLLFHN